MVGGLNGDRMLIALGIGIVLLIVLAFKTKIHAFLALIIAALVIGAAKFKESEHILLRKMGARIITVTDHDHSIE